MFTVTNGVGGIAVGEFLPEIVQGTVSKTPAQCSLGTSGGLVSLPDFKPDMIAPALPSLRD